MFAAWTVMLCTHHPAFHSPRTATGTRPHCKEPPNSAHKTAKMRKCKIAKTGVAYVENHGFFT